MYRRNENLKYFIDISGVEDLRSHSISASELVLGANVSLTETMEILTKASNQIGFEYCKHLVDHIDLIANVPVRNVSSFVFCILISIRGHPNMMTGCIDRLEQ